MLSGHFHEAMQTGFDEYIGEMGASNELDDMFGESMAEAEAYSRVDKNSGIEVKLFMIEHEYTDKTSVANISDEEMEDFFYYSGDDLEYMYQERDSISSGADAMTALLQETLGGITRADVFLSLWGFLDLLFIFFGASAAYQFGSGYKKS